MLLIFRLRRILTMRLAAWCAAAPLLAFGGGTASAQSTWTWNALGSGSGPSDGVGTWSTSNSNWWTGSGTAAWNNAASPLNIAAFGTPTGTGTTVTVSGSVGTSGLIFNMLSVSGTTAGARYTLTGGTIGIGTGNKILVAGTSASTSNIFGPGAPVINSTLVGSNLTLDRITGATGTPGIYLTGTNNNLTGTLTVTGSLEFNATPSAIANVTLDLKAGSVWQMNTGTYANNIVLNSASLNPRHGNPTITGTITLAADGGITANSDRTITITKGIVESGGARNFTVTNRGTTVLLGQSTYSGTTTLGGVAAVSSMILDGGSDRLPTSTVVQMNTTTFQNGLVLGGTYSGSSTASNQTIAGLISSATNVFVRGGATSTSTLTVNLASGTNTFTGILGGTAANANNLALTKSGAGRLTLGGTNTYVGATTISGGTLALAAGGSFDASPTITVGSAGSSGAVLDLTAKSAGFTFGSGQTVKGIGTIQMASGQALTINGTLAAGNSPGTLTIAGGDLALGGSSNTSYEISGTSSAVGGGINDLTTVSGSLTLGGTLNVIASPAFDLFGSRTYRVFNYATSGTGSLAGSMAIGTTPDASYLYSLNTATSGQVNLFVQRREEQSAALAYALPSSGTVNAFTSTNVSFSGTLTNLTPSGGAALGVNLAGTGGQLTVASLSASTGSTVAGGASATVTGQIATGTTLGSRTWSVVNTDTNALGSTTSTATGVVNVFAHGTPTLSGSTFNFGNVLVGSATSRQVTVSNGSVGVPVANTGGITWTAGSTPTGFGAGGSNQSGVIASGSGVNYSYALATGSAGGFSGSQTFTFSDDASLLGAGSLGGLSVSLTGTVFDPATALLVGGSTLGSNWFVNLGEFTQGSGTSSPVSFGISNLLQTTDFTADLTMTSFSVIGDTGTIFSTLTGTSSVSSLIAGGTNGFTAWMSLGTAGTFSNTYNLSFTSMKNGASLGGTPQNVTLTVSGIIVVPEPGAIALAGIGIAAAGWTAWRRRRSFKTDGNGPGKYSVALGSRLGNM